MLPSGLAQFCLCVEEARNCGPRAGGTSGLQASGLAQSLGLVGNPADAFIFLQPSQKVKLLQESRLGILWNVLLILLKETKCHLLCHWAS